MGVPLGAATTGDLNFDRHGWCFFTRVPDLLHAWGEALRQRTENGASVVLAALSLLSALVALYAFGALARRVRRRLGGRKARDTHRPSAAPPTASTGHEA